MMKKYFLTFVLIALTAGFSSLQAATPVIDSPATDTVENGQAYSYDITTAADDALIYNATGLPAGLSLDAETGKISGTPTVSGEFTIFTIRLAASNADGTGRQDLVLNITDPGPSITSPLSISVNEGSPYTYTITASNNPTGFSLVGEGVVEADSFERSNVATNGTFQFTPSAGTAGNTYNLLIGAKNAENDAGSTTEILVVEILPATGVPAAPTATVLPATVDPDYPGTTTSISVSATVTANDDGNDLNGSETIDTVFVRWLNPPNRADGTPRSTIMLTELTKESGTDTYSGIVNVGFNPDDRELGGGDIQLEVVAYQSNTITLDNYAAALLRFTIAPLLELSFPGPDFDADSIASGDPYATARLSTGLFESIRAKINGSGISYTAVDNDPSDNTDGIFNFRAPELIDLPGTYSITVTAVDTDANETVVTGAFSIPEPLSIALSRSGSGDINQGGQVTFEALVSPLEEVSEVEFFDSGTGTSLGQGVRVTREGRTFFQFNRSFPLQGNFGTFATATTFDGQSADSSTLSLSVLRVNDAQVSITSPVSDQTIIQGETVAFTATASATAGIESISWLVDDLVVETEVSSNSSFDFVSGNLGNYGPGSYTVTASALDGFGNVVGAPEEIVVTVIDGTRRTIFVPVGQNFTYIIIGDDDFTLSGLDTIPTDSTDTSTLATTGEFSFTPSPSAEGNIYTLLASASNGDDSALTLITVEVVAAPAPGATVAAGSANAVYPGTTTSIPVSATITPLAGESVDTVFVRWLNPPNRADGTPRDPILLTDLNQEAGTNVYSGTVNVGFNPDDRQLGGGAIELKIGAYQSNSTSIVNYAADTLSFTIAPLIEFLYPDANFASDAIARGDVFASARVGTQQFASVRARIVGGGIAYTDQDDDASDNSNGIFNFISPELIDLPGNYAITITAVDTAGNETVVSGGLLISDTLAGPVAEVSSPSPGFRTEVFSPAVISVDGSGEVVIVGPGQGYYPRNGEASLGITLEDGTEIPGVGVTIENGRIAEVSGGIPVAGVPFVAVIDLAVSDPGIYSRIPITAEFFQANAPLKDFRILLDGKVVKSGTVGADVPLYTYPQPGEGSPKLGEHVVLAQVTDEQGEVGSSLPLSFSVVPYQPLVINLTRTSSGDVNQGEQVTFEAEVSPLEQVTGVEFFDSDTGDSLGQGSRVTQNGRTFYRLTRNFPQQGNYGTFAIATSFDGRTVSSSPVRFSVLAVNDAQVSITNPVSDQTIIQGETVSFSATASASPGIVSINWLVNNVVVRTVNSTQATFEFASGPDVFDEETGELVQDRYGFGTYTVTATALDGFGNVVGAPEEIVVTVIDGNIAPKITSSLEVLASVRDFFFYAIEADNDPTSYAVTGGPLPQGLTLSNNFISGTLQETGVYEIELVVFNEFGFDRKTLTLNVSSTAPAITSPSSASDRVGQTFNFQVTALNDPAYFTIYGLSAFPGLSFNTDTGVISGTPTAVASGDLLVEATNGSGTGSAVITLTIFDPATPAPIITSSLSETLTVGDQFTYSIEADNAPLIYAASGLPNGLSRSGNFISGTPTETGVFEIEISASNSAGSDTETLILTITERAPQITSFLTAVGQVDRNFSYRITSNTNANTYSAIGLDKIGGLNFDASTGLITGKPSNSGSYDILVGATNSAGTDQRVLTLQILDSDAGDGPQVRIVSINGYSPASMPTFDKNTTSLDFEVEVTPDAGETLETAFIRWTNPPGRSSFTDIIVVELTPIGPTTYTGSAVIGFDPTNREIGGGQIALEAVATQRDDGNNQLSFGTSSEETVVIEPLVEFLQPEENTTQGPIPAGGAFTVARLSTNAFEKISASISGVGTIEVVEDDDNSDNLNGVFSFNASSEVSFPGAYTITIRAEDTLGNIVEIDRVFNISTSSTSPVAVIASPTPGFRNDVFSPGSFTWFLDSAEFNTSDEGVITESTYTYILSQVSRGQGYYPRNQGDARLSYSFFDNEGAFSANATVDGNTVVNGRVTQIAETVVFEYSGAGRSFGLNGIGVLDRNLDSGIDSRIDIVADLFRADSPLESFRLFINGDNVTPGSGNLNPDLGPISAPVLTYPPTGTLAPGVYVVTAEVTDADGEVGISRPLVFTIEPFEELDVTITADAVDEVNQGETVTYLVKVEPNDSLDNVEIFDSVTNESLGFASRVTLEGEVFYRFTRTYDEAGTFGLYARASTFSGQLVISNQISLDVLPFNDTEIEITNPDGDTSLIIGSSLTFSAEASATPGIESITWFVNNSPVRTEEASTASFVFATGTQDSQYPLGTYTVTASAIDNFGNEVGSNESITVSVVASDVTISISTTDEDREVIEGEQLTFSASVSSSVGVESVEWYVGDTLIETGTEAPYSFNNEFPRTGEFSIRAEAVDTLGNRRGSSVITISVNPRNPLLRNQDFVTSIYNSLIGRAPNSEELEVALANLDNSLDTRVSFVADLLDSDSVDSVTSVPIIYRTMTGEWPDPQETDQALEDLFGEGSRTETREGTILLFGSQSFSIDIPAGARVSATVRGADAENGVSLVDPILYVYSPFGGFVAYDDDSGPGLTPQITFSAFDGGNYTFTVDGWGSSIGNFVLEVEIFGEGTSTGNPNALTLALLPEYEARFGRRDEALPFIRQLFQNKHGRAPTAQSEVRLFNSANGDTFDYGTREIPGYAGNLDAYAAGFATDNQSSGLQGSSGLPLSSVHYYEQPNNPVQLAGIALLVSGLLGEDPTDNVVNSFSSLGLTQAIRKILTDSRYYSQFPTSTIEGQVAQYLANAGIFDLSENGLDDNPDGDGFNNEAEFNAGTDPNDPTDFPAPEPNTVSMVRSQLEAAGELSLVGPDDDADGDGLSNLQEIALGGDPVDANVGINLDHSIESGDSGEMLRSLSSGGDEPQASAETSSLENTFVLSFDRLKESARPEDMLIVVECSTDLLTWDVADPATTEVVLAVDQSGLGDDYERVQYRVVCDPAEQGSFFRVAVRSAP